MMDDIVGITVATAVTLLLTVGLTYLFYPALVVATQGRRRRCLVESILPTTTSAAASHQSEATSSTSDVDTAGLVVLSIVIPSYNEELRLPVMLQESYDYLTSGKPLCRALQDLVQTMDPSSTDKGSTKKKIGGARDVAVEWIVVDDGSSDQTGQAFRRFVQQKQQQTSSSSSTSNLNNNPHMVWKLVTLPQNAGKGAAVQAGMLVATGSYRLMVDADGATDFAVGLPAMTKQLLRVQQQEQTQKNKPLYSGDHVGNNTIWVGSRAHLQKQQPPTSSNSTDTVVVAPLPAVKSSLIRRLLSASFSVLRTLTLGRQQEIVDTQCGFKLFSATAARAVFTALHLQRWAFDIEVLYLALHLGYPVQEIVVPWHEVDGSKLNTSPWNLAWVSVSMLRDMICVRLCYLTGIWSIHDDKGASRQILEPINR